MKEHIRPLLTTSKYLKWLLLFELLFTAWWINSLWEEKVERQQSRDRYMYHEQQWRSIVQSINALPDDFPVTLVQTNGSVTGIRMTSTMALSQWAELLESIQQRLWLSPSAIIWQRQGDQWYGDIQWNLLRPGTLKPAINILPFDRSPNWAQSGQLVSTVHGTRAAALFKINQQELWLHEGGWSPQLEATITQIDQDYVILQNAQGDSKQVYLTGIKPLGLSQEEQ